MALEGELKDFNILEVIQLLGQQGKTGVLRVWGLGKQGGEAEIFFFDGKITHATSTERAKGDLLGERLAKTSVISRSDLQTALRTQKKTGRFLGEVVVDAGMVEKQRVLNAIYIPRFTNLFTRCFDWRGESSSLIRSAGRHFPRSRFSYLPMR
jgi:choline dehydrogenase-like flavoprotein